MVVSLQQKNQKIDSKNLKIVVLDGYTLNPGDLSWDELYSLGEVQIYDRTPETEVVSRAKGAPILFTNKTILNASILEQLPDVQYIGVLATGYNVVDIDYCHKHNIVVTNVPGYGPKTVAQMVFAHILEFTNRVYVHHLSVVNNEWSKCPDFCYWKYPLIELADKVIGIIGFGAIGREVAHIAQAFGMQVLVKTRTRPQKAPDYVKFVELDELLKQSDFVSLNCPLTSETKHLVNADFLSKMKSTAFLINCGRGDLIDEKALDYALRSKIIAGAGLDVLSQEPPPQDHFLFSCPNIHITPHIAWAARETRARLLSIAIDNLKAFLEGSPRNVI
ncbi:MAG: D-2-hydroxyacid dehydrogenase [Desulfonauticus sp.]|nr:D-2-hydroxyacid dehydrogenase [Desulfonauticus sp.]